MWTYQQLVDIARQILDEHGQVCNARKVNCVCVYSAYILKPVLRRLKALNFDNFDNSHNSFLWPEYFIDFFMWKMDPMSGLDIRLVFTLPPRDITLQYKRCVHFWNNFPCITSLNMGMEEVLSSNHPASPRHWRCLVFDSQWSLYNFIWVTVRKISLFFIF